MSMGKRFKNAVKTQNGFKTIMSILAAEEKSNQTIILSLQHDVPVSFTTTAQASVSIATTANENNTNVSTVDKAFPATTLKINSVLNRGAKT